MIRITPLFGLVLAIHALVIGLLILQPGCQTTTRDTAETEETRKLPERDEVSPDQLATTVRPAPETRPREALTAPSTLDDAFNAGFTVAGPPREQTRPATTETGRQTPQRPGRMPVNDFSSDTLPRDTGPRIAVVDDGPRYADYTVRPGDSLWKIAQSHDVELSALLEANNLSRNSVIHAGQTLRVPLEAPELEPLPTGDHALSSRDLDVETTRYTVQRGDTLSRIAQRFGTTIEELKALNNKRDDVIRIGENLIVPGVAAVTQPTRETAPQPTARQPERRPAEGYTHTVRAGENPTMIANRYGMTTRDLIRLNDNFDPRRLQVGQVLKIEPAPGKEPDRPEAEAPARTPAPTVTRPPEPVRIQVPERQPAPEEEPDFDPSIFFDDVEEIPVQRVDNNR